MALFGKPSKPASAPQPAAAPLAAQPLSEALDAPPEAFAAALGLAPEAFDAAAPPLSAEEDRAARAVVEHFSINHPGPASFPTISLQILDLVRHPDVNLVELAKYIRMDGALASGLLALANSATYRAVNRIETVKDAVSRLGLTEVAKLTAAISTRSLYGPEEAAEYKRFAALWGRLFFHAATVARGASELTKQRLLLTAGPEQVFMAGLLHDVGKSIALRSLAALEASHKVPAMDDAAVSRILHAVHVEVGARMHQVWNMPPTYTAVATHHHDAPVPAGDAGAATHLVRLVSAHDLLRHEPELHPRGPAEILDSARALGLSPARLGAFAKQLDETEAWVEMLFGK
jgi:HD-like signal output (HDOD) protein